MLEQMLLGSREARNYRFLYSTFPASIRRTVEDTPLKNLDHRDALDRMDRTGGQIDSATYACLLRWCGNTKAFLDGKRVHEHLIRSGLEKHSFLGSLVVQMYSRCGALVNAMESFSKVQFKEVASWNSLIRGHARQGLHQVAVQLFHQMQEEGIAPNKVTFIVAVAAFVSQAALADCQRTHARIVEGCRLDVNMGSSFINMYGKCGSVKGASEIFETMPEHDVVAWTGMIAVLTQHGHEVKAVRLFERMQGEGIMPNKITFVSVLDACASQDLLVQGKQIHARVVVTEFVPDVVLETALVKMYGKCGSLENAWAIFEKMPERDKIAWNAMVAVYAQHGHGKRAIQVYNQMQAMGVQPNKSTYVSCLTACATGGMLAEGERIHKCVLDSGLQSDVSLSNALISMYGKCGSLEEARKVFHRMPEQNVFSWTAVIAIYAQRGYSKESCYLFEKMLQAGISPNKVTFLSILSICSTHAALDDGKCLHAVIIDSGFDIDMVVNAALINMYLKCGSLEDAERLFVKMPERDVVLWNSMIAVYAQHGLIQEALQLFHQMQDDGTIPDGVTFLTILHACSCYAVLSAGVWVHVYMVKKGLETDVVTGTALISMYGRCGSLEDAQRVHDKMPEWHVTSWNIMISVYSWHRQTTSALQLYKQMQQKGVMPDKITLVSILDACASHAALVEGERVHACTYFSGFELDVVLGTALITMYGKCGSLGGAKKIFDNMPTRNRVSWNAIIAVHAQHGLGKEVLKLFDSMQREDIMPDKVTFVSILGACSHAGLVEEGHSCLALMERDYGILPTIDHYTCMVNLLGRAGHVNEAEALTEEMPFQPTAMPFLSVLGACRYQTNVEQGKCAANHVCELDPANPVPYVNLANIFVEAVR